MKKKLQKRKEKVSQYFLQISCNTNSSMNTISSQFVYFNFKGEIILTRFDRIEFSNNYVSIWLT